MRFFTYLMISALILSVAVLFVIKRPDGQSWLRAENFIPDTQVITANVQLLKTKAANQIKRVFSKSFEDKTKVYKWQDTQGSWHFSDKQPSSVSSEEVLIDANDSTVMPAFEPTTYQTKDSGKKKRTPAELQLPLTISPKDVTKLIQDAKQLQQIVDKRHASYLKDL